MSINHKHSIFGDYLTGDVKSIPVDELDGTLLEIEDYNALWRRYTNEILGKWGLGSIPTEKGFEEWLQRQLKEVSNGR